MFFHHFIALQHITPITPITAITANSHTPTGDTAAVISAAANKGFQLERTDFIPQERAT